MYRHRGGRIPGEPDGTVTYTLVLTPDSCAFFVSGDPVTEGRIACRADAKGDTLSVRFDRFEKRGGPATRAKGLFSPGDRLFELRRAGEQLITAWQGYPLGDGELHGPGEYFRR